MKGISRYATLSLAALAVFLLGIFGYFLANRPGDALPWTVQTAGSASSQVRTGQAPEEESATPDSLLEGERINLNTAPAADLRRLPGIGEKRAQAIVDYREEHGPFESLEALMEVSGIGPGIFEGVRDYISID